MSDFEKQGENLLVDLNEDGSVKEVKSEGLFQTSSIYDFAFVNFPQKNTPDTYVDLLSKAIVTADYRFGTLRVANTGGTNGLHLKVLRSIDAGKNFDIEVLPQEILSAGSHKVLNLEGYGTHLKVQVKSAELASRIFGSGNSAFRVLSDVVDGTDIRVSAVAAAGASAPTTVAVSGRDITITLGTGSTAGVVNATANQVITAINGTAAAAALVTASLPTGSDGTGVASAFAFTNLASGSTSVSAKLALARGIA